MAISAIISERLFNDCPTSNVVTNDSYPTSISIADTMDAGCVGFANLHTWSLSDDDVTAKLFPNNSNFTLSADVTISGADDGQSGLRISPWYSNVDGYFSLNTSTGEIACYGGRLPFYNFTTSHLITYTKGDTVNLKMIYIPNDLDAGNPATIEYIYNDGTEYTSGPIQFDEGNPGEDPPYGLWGMLNDATVGGFTLVFVLGSADTLTAVWDNIVYTENSETNTSSMFLMF